MPDREEDLKEQFFALCWSYKSLRDGFYPPLQSASINDALAFVSYQGTFHDFIGFPSAPISIYKTGDEWPLPQYPGGWADHREARPTCNHPIQGVWPTLGRQIYEFLDSLNVKWTTIDPLRFAVEEGGEAGPLHLWIGVEPKTLAFEDARVAAIGCKDILAKANFPDIEIAFRESVYISSFGPRLLSHVNIENPLSDVRNPFTPALSIQIASQDSPHLEGCGTLYLRESSESDQVLLLTARHVVLPQSVYPNELYKHRSKTNRPQRVLILGSNAYADAIGDIMSKMHPELVGIMLSKNELNDLGEVSENEDAEKAAKRQECQYELKRAEKAVATVNKFHDEMSKYWTTPSQRVLGHVLYSPPVSLSTGREQFMVDWALVQIDRDRIDWSDFKGNTIYLGKKSFDYILKMCPHRQDHAGVNFPFDGYLEVNGFLGENEIHKPTQLDEKGEACLIVIKRGLRTGVTIGRGSNLMSFIRKYDEHGMKLTSMELPIYSHSHKDHSFSVPGDSGSVVVDRSGRAVGLLTGGAGKADHLDVTYLTPYYWIEQEIKKVFPNSFLYTT